MELFLIFLVLGVLIYWYKFLKHPSADDKLQLIHLYNSRKNQLESNYKNKSQSLEDEYNDRHAKLSANYKNAIEKLKLREAACHKRYISIVEREQSFTNILIECQQQFDDALKLEQEKLQESYSQKEIRLKLSIYLKQQELEKYKESLTADYNKKNQDLQIKKDTLSDLQRECKQQKSIYESKIKDIPTLARISADIIKERDLSLTNYLRYKKHPSTVKASEIEKFIHEEKYKLNLKLKELQYKCTLYESLVPYLSDLDDDDKISDIDDSEISLMYNSSADPITRFISAEEYNRLSSIEKSQLALDRWWNRKYKTKAEIGADYERYIGYLAERGLLLDHCQYDVIYNGIEQGLKDMGIDLICRCQGKFLTVQCKNWSSQKTIHEKHINQLFGTTVDFYLNHINPKGTFSDFYSLLSNKTIIPLFVTSTTLSNTAKRVADTLGVQYIENKKFNPYPIIKCNVSSKGEKIYHLPFDQQYDRTKINGTDEFYALTVKEAEDKGFRRAQKHFFK